jgi:hypothetical protein
VRFVVISRLIFGLWLVIPSLGLIVVVRARVSAHKTSKNYSSFVQCHGTQLHERHRTQTCTAKQLWISFAASAMAAYRRNNERLDIQTPDLVQFMSDLSVLFFKGAFFDLVYRV